MFYELFLGNDEVPLQHGVGEKTSDANLECASGFIRIIDHIAHLHMHRPHAGIHVHDRRHCAISHFIQDFPAIAFGK